MTLDEAKIFLLQLHTDKQLNKSEHEALRLAIKALERESMLDKIRAEIDSYCSDNRDRNDGLYIAMRIIDKYKESEVKP